MTLVQMEQTLINFLKIKAWIYQKTGIYLAHKEELEYITSPAFWKKFMKIVKHKDNDMAPRDIQGLLIGIWQGEHGFYRRLK
jgi:hypothetical protein